MKKLLLLSILLAPSLISAMQDDDKGYCEAVMGSLIFDKETPTPDGSLIEGTFRKGDKVSCLVDSAGNPTAKIITKKGEEIDPEAFFESSDHLHELLMKKAAKAQQSGK